jgi:hypothetical protein
MTDTKLTLGKSKSANVRQLVPYVTLEFTKMIQMQLVLRRCWVSRPSVLSQVVLCALNDIVSRLAEIWRFRGV